MNPTINLIAVPSLDHTDPTHPENAKRVPAILEALDADAVLSPSLRRAPPVAPITTAQLTTVHEPDYIEALQQVMARAPGYIDSAPTYITPQSFECASLAAGGALAAVEATAEGGDTVNGHQPSFALIRPPGHHAPPDRAMGFCLFNNIALAARHAQSLGLPRVMIYDFDVHHGNGTQSAFYADPSVLFISSHQSGIYPGMGYVQEIGEGPGEGYTINIPLPAGAGDAGFRRILDEIVRPAAERFQPDILLISAGYDAHWRDPLASLQLSCAGYHWLGSSLMELAQTHCQGRLVFILEGGYDLAALAHGVRNTMRGVLGLPADDPLGPAPDLEPSIAGVLEKVKTVHGL